MRKNKIRHPRREWVRSPATKVKASAKVYSRKKSDKISKEKLLGKRDYQYCPVCSAELIKKALDKIIRMVCNVCGFVYYQNPVPAAAVLIEKEGKILLVQRKFKPFALDWSLPSGFIEYDETPEGCATRETQEETGLKIKINRLFNIYLAQDDPRTHVILIVYIGEILQGKLKAGDDAQEVQFFSPAEIPANMAFTAHKRALKEYFETKPFKEFL